MNSQSERNTKYKFMVEALRLFAEKGYEAVSVSQIASSVGCSAPALYKHYKSKQDLFEAILEESENKFSESVKKDSYNFSKFPEMIDAYIKMDVEQEIGRVQELIKYAIHNEFAQAFRKMCAVEQFHMPELAKMYTLRYVTYHFEQYEILFKAMIEKGVIPGGNPKTLAKTYMSLPIIVIGICDREPYREDECMEMIADHVREFNRIYLNR